MGYTRNWYRLQIIAASTFNAISQDFQKVLPALHGAGSPIANAYGLEEPEVTAEHIRFNGVRHCGHAKNPEVRLPWPGTGASGIGDNSSILSGTLPHRTCNGDCSYESVWFDRCMDEEDRDENGLSGGFCKTAYRPYDLALTVFPPDRITPSWQHFSDPDGWRSEAVAGRTRLMPRCAGLPPQHRGGYRMKMTYRIAHALGSDAANRQMKEAGRTGWNEEDYILAAATLSRLLPLCMQVPGIEPELCGCSACDPAMITK